MVLGINSQNEIVAVNDIIEGLTVIEVDDDSFLGKDPTQYKIKAMDNWQEITPRYLTKGI